MSYLSLFWGRNFIITYSLRATNNSYVCFVQYACVLKLKIMSIVNVGIIVILLDAACGKKESVHKVHYLLPALL
jgi:hypothetical protein